MPGTVLLVTRHCTCPRAITLQHHDWFLHYLPQSASKQPISGHHLWHRVSNFERILELSVVTYKQSKEKLLDVLRGQVHFMLGTSVYYDALLHLVSLLSCRVKGSFLHSWEMPRGWYLLYQTR